ncbi:ABC transporter permease [Mycetocola reblochoni]|uniref:ABC transporter permease protein n=2 Tax=Mycetocola reblochoni TaxID=331618 RepID=A0A1R4K3H4_9MICO|nr:ABC transporter permease [Mycetocola reblochoni]RLP68227.1 ABC transporter permease [Mycetocola reblochoni]SJN38778.1 ABC transporter permease protein [Mycetocola reblochoni REB411]
MSLIYARTEFIRRGRDGANLFFILALPVAMYLVFGPNAGSTDGRSGHGSTEFYVMVSMALYGAATAMTTLTGSAATEVSQGWGRQLALSPLSTGAFVTTKVLVALAYSAICIAVLFAVGAATGATADAGWRWAACAGIVLLGSSIFALYGLAVGLVFRSDSALGIASALLTLFAFFGNVFLPLDGTMLDIARFTPLYGVVGLARWPLLEGAVVGQSEPDSLLGLIGNVLGWAVLFGTAAVLAVRRSRARR